MMEQYNQIINLKKQIVKEVFFDDTMDNTKTEALVNLVILEFFSTYTFANANTAILDIMENTTADVIVKYTQTKKNEYLKYKDSIVEIEKYMKSNMSDFILKDEMFGKTITNSAIIKHKNILVDWYSDLTRDRLSKCLIYDINILDRFVYLLEQYPNKFLSNILPYYVSKLYAPRISRQGNDYAIAISKFTEKYIGLHTDGKINQEVLEEIITDDAFINNIKVNRDKLLNIIKAPTQSLSFDKNKNGINLKMSYVSCALYHSIIFARLVKMLDSCNTTLCCYMHACENVIFETYYDLAVPLSYETIVYSLIRDQGYSQAQAIAFVTEKRAMILNYLQGIVAEDYLLDFLDFDPYHEDLFIILLLYHAENDHNIDQSIGFDYHQIKHLPLKDAHIVQYTNKETKIKRNLEKTLYTKMQLRNQLYDRWEGGKFPPSHLS